MRFGKLNLDLRSPRGGCRRRTGRRREVSAGLPGTLLRLKADTEVQARHDELADRNTEGVLSAEERAELESLVRANSILSLLKAEASAFLEQPKAA